MIKRNLMLGVLLVVGLVTVCLCYSPGTAGPKIPLSMSPTPPPPFAPEVVDTVFNTWLSYDNGIGYYFFPLPDQYDDHYFNVRFSNPDSCRLLRAAFLFRRVPGDSTSISRDMHIVIFEGTPSPGLLPPFLSPDSSALDSVNVPGDSILVYPETTFVDLSGLDLHFSPNERFHIAWEPNWADTDSTVGVRALLGDPGQEIPPNEASCEWWEQEGRWGTILQDWDHNTNFMLRVEIEDFGPPPSGLPHWLEPGAPATFALYGASPNPFNPTTTISYQLQVASQVSLQVYDTAGRMVTTLVNGWRQAGAHEVTFDGSSLPSGLYFTRLEAGVFTATQKMVLLK